MRRPRYSGVSVVLGPLVGCSNGIVCIAFFAGKDCPNQGRLAFHRLTAFGAFIGRKQAGHPETTPL
jgi:hypothetical protein